MEEIKVIDGYYYLVEEDEKKEDSYIENNLYSGMYDGLLIINGRPHTGLSTGDFDEDVFFIFTNNLPADILENINVYGLAKYVDHDYEKLNVIFCAYKNGLKSNGKFGTVYYNDGKLVTLAVIDDLLIIEGLKFIGENGGKCYSEGKLCDGEWVNNKHKGIPSGFYRDGIRLVGKHVISGEEKIFHENSELYKTNYLDVYTLMSDNEIRRNMITLYGWIIDIPKKHPFRLFNDNDVSIVNVFKTDAEGVIELYKYDKKFYYSGFTGVVKFEGYDTVYRYFKDGEEIFPSLIKRIKMRLFNKKTVIK